MADDADDDNDDNDDDELFLLKSLKGCNLYFQPGTLPEISSITDPWQGFESAQNLA